MSTDELQARREDDGIVWLILSRPEHLNALNLPLAGRLRARLSELNRDPASA